MCLFVVGRQCFREFLKSEFSEENVEFWIACDDYKNLKASTGTCSLTAPAQKIFAEFIVHQAPREVGDSKRLVGVVSSVGSGIPPPTPARISFYRELLVLRNCFSFPATKR